MASPTTKESSGPGRSRLTDSDPVREEKPASAEPSTSSSSSLALRGASLLILLQVGSRALTFIANQILLRYLTAELLGIATQLEFFYMTVIFFARESLRVAIQRQGSTATSRTAEAESTQAVVNLGFLPMVIGLPLSLGLGILYMRTTPSSTLVLAPDFPLSLQIYALAALTELLSEPAFVVMQIRLHFGARASAEAIATVLRCILTLGTAVYAARTGAGAGAGAGTAAGVLPFALGQLGYGTGLLLVYAYHGMLLARSEGFSLLPRGINSDSDSVSNLDLVMGRFYRPTLAVAGSMLSQSLVKHVLTQGDTLLVTLLSTAETQGVYALANNYGGLVARLLFQPVEESARNFFSRLLVDSNNSSNKNNNNNIHLASHNLSTLLHLYTLLSLPIVVFGPPAAPLLLSLVAGRAWSASGAGSCLSSYALYIPFLALNGLLEAFVASAASSAELHAQSLWMAGFSLAFAAAGWLCLGLLHMGGTGLVLANGVNMALRIMWCCAWVAKWFSKRGTEWRVLDWMPSGATVGVSVVVAQVVRRLVPAGGEADAVKDVFVALGRIAAVAVPYLAVLAFAERRFLLNSLQDFKGRGK